MKTTLIGVSILSACLVAFTQTRTDRGPVHFQKLDLYLGEWHFRPDLSEYTPLGNPTTLKVSKAAEFIRFDQWETLQGQPSMPLRVMSEVCVPDKKKRLISSDSRGGQIECRAEWLGNQITFSTWINDPDSNGPIFVSTTWSLSQGHSLLTAHRKEKYRKDGKHLPSYDFTLVFEKSQ
jgi:hypothetical protein